MKKLLISISLAVVAVTALALAPGQRPSYRMYQCPGTLGTDENGQPRCRPPVFGLCAAGTCNGGAPTDAGSGMSLQGLSSYRVTVCAPQVDVFPDAGIKCATYADAGCYVDGGVQSWPEVLKGDGGLNAYYYNSDHATWTRDPQLDVQVTVSGVACQTFPDFLVGSQYGRVAYSPSNVWVQLPDGGADDAGIEIMLDGQAVQDQHWN